MIEHRTRGPLLLGAIAPLLLALVGTGMVRADATPKPNRPNILFLFSDDQRAETIAAVGGAPVRTPHLDRLASEGTALTRAYCMGSLQGAVCVPSRAMLLTGRTLFRIKDDLAGQATWPERFGEAGYSTFATGKWHNKPEALLRSFQQGRTIFLGGMGDPYTLPVQDIGPDHSLVNRRPSGTHSAQLFADSASEFLRAQTGSTPFLCYVAFNVPHDPRIAPPEYHDRYEASKPPLPANFLPLHPFDNGALTGRDERLAPWPRTPDDTRRQLADYYASIEHLDTQIGRILDALRASGQYENTLIVFASDHGLAIGSHGLFGKQNLYDHSMRAPVVIAGPGIPAGRRLDAFCYLLDLFPTLGELAGVAGPEGSEGLSLVPVLAGREPTRRTSIYTAYATTQRAVRDDRWKLIAYPQINKTQLFDLRADPGEMHDLAARPAHSAEVARLAGLLRDWQARLGDPQALSTTTPQPQEFDYSKAGPAPPRRPQRP